ncbi:MAG: vanadium-dependent haloperoxidase, partial [Mycetocola sp.]
GVLAPAVNAPADAHPHHAASPAVITEWNAIADRTIFAENATPVPASTLYFGFVSLAMYDAVVAIEGEFEPYIAQPRAHRHASPEVAAATAAYVVLKHYFPASADNLKADYGEHLSGVRNGVGLVQGIRVGIAAALSLIQSREGDGRNAAITFDAEPAPGVWRPTPDAFAPFAVPWLGFVRPLAIESATHVRLLAPPNALTSAAYATEFAEVKAFGAKTGSSRDALQTETALFYNANAASQYYAAMRDAVTRRGLDIVESARAFALLGTSTADAAISCWRAKLDFPTWRPITAIHLADTDGNPDTEPDPGWVPLAQAPPYPDYVSGQACLTGSSAGTFGYLFGENSIDINVSSSVTSTTRHYDTTDALDQDTMNARIWLGIHVRTSMVVGNQLGHDVSELVSSTRFQPVD